MSGYGIKTRHGRCVECKTRYTWDGLPLLRDARCPKCKMDLLMGNSKHDQKISLSFERPLVAGQDGVR